MQLKTNYWWKITDYGVVITYRPVMRKGRLSLGPIELIFRPQPITEVATRAI